MIAIIAMLAALLLPALGTARARATLTKCMSNVRQHGTAVMLYAGDFNDYVPKKLTTPAVATDRCNGWTVGFGYWNYYVLVWPYAGSSMDLWIDPAIAGNFKSLIQGTYLPTDVGFLDLNGTGSYDAGELTGEFLWWGGYGLNAAGPLRLSDLLMPSEMCLEAESGTYDYAKGNWLNRATALPNSSYYVPGAHDIPSGAATGYRRREATEGRHPEKKVSVLFGDGHVAPVNARTQRDLPTAHPFWDNVFP